MAEPSPTEIAALIQKAQTNPTWFIEDILGSPLWAKQRQIANSVRDNPRTAVRSCHGAGKSYVAARIALWYLYAFPRSIVLTTAPTFRQVRRVLWKEINTAHRGAKFPLGGNCLTTELQIDTDWWALGFSADDPDAVQGFHAERILVVLDEAPGVSPEIWTAIEGALSSENARLLAIGNPTEMGGPFYDEFRFLPDHAKMHISAFDTPNLKAGKTVVPGLVTKEWVETRRQRWGEKSPMYQSRVLGDFPEFATDQLISLAWVEAAQNRTIEPVATDEVELAVDVARYGDDDTIIGRRHGSQYRRLDQLHGLRTTEVAGHIVRRMQSENAARVRIEGAASVGTGPIDMLYEDNVPVIEMIPGSAAQDTAQFLNARAEWWWGLRERFERGEIDLDMAADEELAAQLTAIKYKFTASGKIQIESKEDMKKRGMSSPDEADTLMLAFAHGDTQRMHDDDIHIVESISERMDF